MERICRGLSLIIALLLSCTACGGGGAGAYFFGGLWLARDIILANENCFEAIPALADLPPLDDFEYSIEQDGSTIVYTDEDGSVFGTATDDGFMVTPAQRNFSVADGEVDCIIRGDVEYKAGSDSSGRFLVALVFDCRETTSEQAVFACQLDYEGTAERVDAAARIQSRGLSGHVFRAGQLL